MPVGDRVEIIIQLSGDRNAYNSLANLKSAIDKIRNSKVSLQLDASRIRNEINKVRIEIDRINDGARIHGLTAEAESELLRLSQRLEDLQRQLRDVNNDIQFDTGAIRAAAEDLRTMKEEALSLSRAFEGASKALDSLASGIGGLNKFADGITSAFGKMSDIFSTNITENLSKAFADMLAQNMVGSFQSAIQRYDILNTFEQYMGLAGISAPSANASLSRINQSILGLPIGLDEAAQRLRRYQMFLGDLDQATNLTIGIQNALFAGGASAQMRNQSLIMIDRLLSAGRLNTSRQWLSLIQGLGVSVRYLSEEMGVAVTDVKDFASGLTSGAISTDDFLHALMRLGEGSSDAAKKLNDALDVYKTTLESWMMNIQFAFTRGTANLMNAINESLERVAGTDITGYLSRFRGAVNDFYASGVEVVGDDERVGRFAGAVERLLDALGRFDGQLIAGGIIDNMARVIDMFAQGLRRLPVGETEKFVAFATTIAGPLAKLFTTMSSGLPVMLGVFQRFKDFDFESLLDKIITQAHRLASAVSALLSVIPDGIMGDLMAFALVWGRPLVAVLTGLSGALKALGAALSAAALAGGAKEAFFTGGLLSWLIKLAATHPVATGIVAGVLALKAVFSALDGAIEKGEKAYDKLISGRLAARGFNDLTPLYANIQSAVKGVADSRAAYEKELDGIAATADKQKELAAKILEADAAIEGTDGADREAAIARRNTLMKQLGEISDDFSMSLNAENNMLEENAKAQLRNADAIVESYRRIEEARLIESRISSLTREQIELEDLAKKLDEERAKQKQIQKDIVDRRNQLFNDAPEHWIAMYSGRDMIGDYSFEGYAGWIKELEGLDAELAKTKPSMFASIIQRAFLQARLASIGVELTDNGKRLLELEELIGLATGAQVDSLNAVEQKLKEVQEEYKKLRDEIAETIKATATGFEKFEAPKTQKAQDTINNLNARKAFADQLAGDLDLVIGAIMDNPDMFPDKTMAAEFIERLVSSPEENAGIINGIAENIRKGKPQWADDVAKAYVESMTSAMSATNKTDFALALAAGLKNGISAINWEDYSLTEEQAAEIIRTVMGFRGGDVVDIPVRFQFTPGESEGGLDDLLDEHGNLLDTYTARQRLKTQRLEKEIDKAQGAVEKTVEQIIQGVDGINKSLKNISDDGLKTIEAAANRAADQLSHVSDAVEGIGTAIDNRSGTMDGFVSILDSIGDEANHASSEIYRLRDAILSLEDKEVNITVNKNEVGGTVRGNPNGPVDAKFATGGPSGTDTISAWLTPGEYVMRKGAVDKLGQSFLSRLNSLDFKGAIDSMMHQYYRAPSMQTMASYTNNSYDNRNITVNQNVSTNNPDYAGRRIVSRYARALRG